MRKPQLLNKNYLKGAMLVASLAYVNASAVVSAVPPNNIAPGELTMMTEGGVTPDGNIEVYLEGYDLDGEYMLVVVTLNPAICTTTCGFWDDLWGWLVGHVRGGRRTMRPVAMDPYSEYYITIRFVF